MSTNIETVSKQKNYSGHIRAKLFDFSAEANQRLRAERDRISASLMAEESAINEMMAVWTESDIGSESQIRDMEYSHLEGLSRRVRLIDESFRRIKAGAYGYCAECGARIGQNRLENDPAVARCFICQSASEHNKPRLSI